MLHRAVTLKRIADRPRHLVEKMAEGADGSKTLILAVVKCLFPALPSGISDLGHGQFATVAGRQA
jgi:hypothetical protein